jgi:hypothetical protein
MGACRSLVGVRALQDVAELVVIWVEFIKNPAAALVIVKNDSGEGGGLRDLGICVWD